MRTTLTLDPNFNLIMVYLLSNITIQYKAGSAKNQIGEDFYTFLFYEKIKTY